MRGQSLLVGEPAQCVSMIYGGRGWVGDRGLLKYIALEGPSLQRFCWRPQLPSWYLRPCMLKLTQSILLFAELAGALEVTCYSCAPSVEGQVELGQSQAVQSTCHHCFGPARWVCSGSAEQAEEGWGNKNLQELPCPVGSWAVLGIILYKTLIVTAPNCRGFSEASGDFVWTSGFVKAAPSKSTAMQTRYLWVWRFTPL